MQFKFMFYSWIHSIFIFNLTQDKNHESSDKSNDGEYMYDG